MKKFDIFHPKNGLVNSLLRKNTYEYEKVFSLECEHILDVYHMTQNDFNHDYIYLQLRNTTLGDIILDVEENKYYFINNGAYLEISEDVVKPN